ncbi:MAG: hypothetical protein J6J24_04595 [Clostridia bacterium]|nr:hypothetical protein [Clostridia bacterium]
MLVSRNFKDKSVIETLSEGELWALDELDKEGQRHGRNTYVCLINENFEGKGRRLFVAVPTKRADYDKLHYETYLINSWDKEPKKDKRINSYFKDLDSALFMADALYGAEDIVDEAGREYKARLELEKREKENQNNSKKLSAAEELGITKESFGEIYKQLDEVIDDMKTVSHELCDIVNEPERTK